MSKEKIDIKIGNIQITSNDPGNNSKIILMMVLMSLLLFTVIVCLTMKSWAGTILFPVLGFQPVTNMLKRLKSRKPDP